MSRFQLSHVSLACAAMFIIAGLMAHQPALAQSELLPVPLDDAYGYIDGSGAVVIPARFDAALPFEEDRAAVRLVGKWGFIDRSGALIVEAG